MSSFLIKIIAIISMFLDHTGILFDYDFLRIIGRLAFPLFAFQSVNGYIYSKSYKKHMNKLLLFSVISQIPYIFFIIVAKRDYSLNIMFTIYLALASMFLYDNIKNKKLGLLVVLLISYLGAVIDVDGGMWAILVIFSFYYFKDKKILLNISFILLAIIKYIFLLIGYKTYYYLFLILGSICALIPINLYNKKEGIKLKYFFYLFYPLHFIILIIIYNIVH